ncbi:MAG: GatB/YqeY domain-containing protein [Candidatus Levybacteria bacterium]|nr:GatB/YqeY domain-containing protein [Candidatus Levybacteria bacterium]
MTKQQLREELKQSMLAKDELKTSVLRLLLSALNYYEIQKGLPRRFKAGGAGYEASDEDVLVVIERQAKQRNDSIEQFEKAGRQDLANKEKKELEILKKYLPEQMSEDEVKSIVEQTITETGATSMQDMGKLMGALNGKLKGKADMGMVSGIVKSKLTS